LHIEGIAIPYQTAENPGSSSTAFVCISLGAKDAHSSNVIHF